MAAGSAFPGVSCPVKSSVHILRHLNPGESSRPDTSPEGQRWKQTCIEQVPLFWLLQGAGAHLTWGSLGQDATYLKKCSTGLPWWRSGWESACQCRGHGFEPWSGKVPHAAEQLGPWATTTEPARLEPVLRNRRGRDSERPAHRDEAWPHLLQLEKALVKEMKTQYSQKLKIKKERKKERI